MTFSEPILESLPQVLVILCLWGQSPELIRGRSGLESIFFTATFASSVFSAAKGLTDFLLYGPCKLLPNDGLFGGMGKMGYIFLLINIAFTICGKGIYLGLGEKNDVYNVSFFLYLFLLFCKLFEILHLNKNFF